MQFSVLLYAMTDKGVAVFDALHAAAPGLVRAVISARDPGTADDSYERLATACAERGVPFHDRSDAPPVAATHAIAVGWRWIIPERPDTTLVVFHDSLLPRYRGFNPLVTALLNGDAETGVTALLATGEYDRGDILGQARVALTPRPMRIGEAIGRICGAYAELATDLAVRLGRGEPLSGTPQDEALASYSLWRDDADYEMDWARPAEWLRDFVHAVGPPYAGARTRLDGRPVRVHDAAVDPDVTIANRTPGKVIFLRDGRPTVVCGRGLLRVDALTDEAGGDNLLPLRRLRVRFG